MQGDLPEFRDWSVPAVWLLRGVVYAEDEHPWNLLLSNVSRLEEYFARLGLRLVVNEPEGMAYLRQLEEDELAAGYETLPRLFRSSRLRYGPTLMAVLLRDEYRQFEEQDVHNERCVVEEQGLFEQWKAFFPMGEDDLRQQREMLSALRKLEALGFVRHFGDDPPSWEVRRILKARLSAAQLETLRDQLSAAARQSSERSEPRNETGEA